MTAYRKNFKVKANLKFSGQSIAEYGLVGVLVVIVAIGGLTLLQQVFSNKLTGFNQTLTATQSSLKKIAPSNSALTGTFTGAETNSTGLKGSLSNLDLNTTYTRSMYFVETAGASGQTDSWATQISKLAQDLKAQGEISPEQYQAVIALSNQGHRMANIQNLVEQAWQNAQGDTSKFYDSKITIDGQNYTPADISAFFDSDESKDPANPLAVLTSNRGGEELMKFKSLFKAANNLDVLTLPASKEIVTDLSFKILSISDKFQNSVFDYKNNQKGSFEILLSENYSEPTHKNSDGICVLGNGLSSGKNCT